MGDCESRRADNGDVNLCEMPMKALKTDPEMKASRTRGSNREVMGVRRKEETLGLISMGDCESKGADNGGLTVSELGMKCPKDGTEKKVSRTQASS